jgi:excisionase family DNA binding protein
MTKEQNLPQRDDFPTTPMKVAELATWLGVSRRFIECQVAHGKLRVRRLSARCVRILPNDLRDWLEV